MDKHYESVYHAAEDTNWWFKARQDFIYRYLLSHQYPTDVRILDIGCGGGGLLSYLRERGYTALAGIDLSPEAIAFCRSRGLTDVHLDDAQNVATFSAESFDVIIASDVLEHLPEDAKALARWQDLLKPGGVLIVFVPAYQALWSERDVVNKHITRYTRPRILAMAKAIGLEVQQSSYWNFCMFLPYALLLKIKRFTTQKIVAISKDETLVNQVLKGILVLENTHILKGRSFPFGVSFLAIFKK